MTITKTARIIYSATLLLLTVVFGRTYIGRARLPYNEEGLYFDEKTMVIYHEQAKEVYGLVSIIFLALTVIAIARTLQLFRTRS